MTMTFVATVIVNVVVFDMAASNESLPVCTMTKTITFCHTEILTFLSLLISYVVARFA